MVKPRIDFFDSKDLPWRPIPEFPGTAEKVLSYDPDTGATTRLWRSDPGGAHWDKPSAHDHWEEMWIVEGSLHDLVLGKVFTAGMYACQPPGLLHGPRETPEGCVALEIHYPAHSGVCCLAAARKEKTG